MIILRRWNDKQNGDRNVITQTPWGGSNFLAPQTKFEITIR